MTTHTFGGAADEHDTLVLQGRSYTMQQIGMRAMRRLLDARAQLTATNGDVDPSTQLDASIELIVASVIPEERDQLRDHIEESVGPGLIAEMVVELSKGVSDLDPTKLPSSSDGSSPTGPSSTDGAALTESTPTD